MDPKKEMWKNAMKNWLQAHWVDWDAEEAGAGSVLGVHVGGWAMAGGLQGTWLKGGIFDAETSTSYISDTELFPINHLINIYRSLQFQCQTTKSFWDTHKLLFTFPCWSCWSWLWTILWCCCCQESFPPRTVATLSCPFCVQCTAGTKRAMSDATIVGEMVEDRPERP